MLSLVAGPFPISTLDPMESTLLVTQGRGIWLDGLGFLVQSDLGSTHESETYLLQPDGRGVRLGYQRSSPPTLGWSCADNKLVLGWGIYGWFKTSAPAFPTGATRAAWMSSSFGVLPDRAIAFDGQHIFFGGLDTNDGLNTIEYIFADGTPNSLSMIAYAGQVGSMQHWWCLSSAGDVRRYDSTNKVAVGHRTAIGGAWRVAGYSRKHDLFCAVRRDSGVDQLYWYANEPVAATISAPSFATAPKRGEAVLVSSQVLGALGELCPGRDVQFSASVGSVDPTCVATDATGTATTRYYPPAGSAPSGATITATMPE